ncbi:MAG: helix-turn-helix transcriptional regulator [Oscillospiraceae bacterium]|nr:helix-turn-helix transcriptional regulator [Oscillospiraceae bacterium]
MNTIGERLKWLRKDQKLTQQAFADKLGLKRNTVGGYEIGTVTMSDRTIGDVCTKFAVNEVWLRTGEGEPYIQLSRQAEIARIISAAMKASPEREALICALANATDDQIRAVHALVMKYAEEYGIRNGSDP